MKKIVLIIFVAGIIAVFTYFIAKAQVHGTIEKFFGSFSTLQVTNLVAGSDTEVQFNDNGVFGADASFTFSTSTFILTVDQFDAATTSVATSTVRHGFEVFQRIGIGSTATTTILGNTATSTFSGGIVLASGCFLLIDGTCATSDGAHNILSSTHSDSLAGTVVRGDLMVGNSTPAWSRLAAGASSTILTIDANGDTLWTDYPSLENLTVVNRLSTGVLAIDLFAEGDTHFTGDLFVNGGDINLGTGSATTTISGNGTGIGIGVTNPLVILDIESSVSSEIDLENTGSASTIISGDADRSGTDQGVFQLMAKWNGKNVGRMLFLSGDDTTNKDDGYITFEVGQSNSLSEAMRIEQDGFVGIGTTSPWGLLSVNPNGISGPSFAIGSSTQTDFVVTNGGNVGIGTASPGDALQVVGDIALGNSATGDFDGTIYFADDGDAQAERFYWDDERTLFRLSKDLEFDTDGSALALNANNANRLQFGDPLLLQSQAGRNIRIDPNNAGADIIELGVSGDNDITRVYGQLDVQEGNVGIGTTTPDSTLTVIGSTNITTSLVVNNTLFVNGSRVGIGTTSPSEMLEVKGNLKLANGGAEVRLVDSNDVARLLFGTSYMKIGGTGANTAHGLDADADAVIAGEFEVKSNLYVDGGTIVAGNVGIGTTSPSQLLSVNGQIYSGTGGFRFPDGSVQTVAAASAESGTAGQLTFYATSGTTVSGTSTIFIASDEKVGIGTANPSRTLDIYNASVAPDLRLITSGNDRSLIIFDGNRSSTDTAVGTIVGRWDGTDIGLIEFVAGNDTTNKDDGYITFEVGQEGTISEAMRIEQNGNVLMPNLQTTGEDVDLCMIASTGELIEDGTASCTSSSRSVKRNITKLTYGLDELLQLKPVAFNYKWDLETPRMGLVADDVLEVMPELVYIDDNGEVDTLHFYDIFGVIVSAIQDLNKKVDSNSKLEERIRQLEARLNNFENQCLLQ